MSALDEPVDVETSFISITLNSNILSIFLAGIYTPLYCGAIYVYYTKNSSKHHLVPAAITLLYLSNIVYTAFVWYETKWEFVDNGATRDSVFTATFAYPLWVGVTENALSFISFSIADGLLIWRCFHVWNRSWRIVLVPLILMGTEITLYLVYTSLTIKYGLYVTEALATKLNDIQAASLFITFGTNVVTTVLIAYRIYSVSNQEGTARRFKHIIDIVAQSGAVYALSQFLAAMSAVLPELKFISNAHGVAFLLYMQTINMSTAGIATTVMFARVALLSAETTYPPTSVHLSGLQFHAFSTHPTANTEEITPSINGDRISAVEGQAVKEKTLSNMA